MNQKEWFAQELGNSPALMSTACSPAFPKGVPVNHGLVIEAAAEIIKALEKTPAPECFEALMAAMIIEFERIDGTQEGEALFLARLAALFQRNRPAFSAAMKLLSGRKR